MMTACLVGAFGLTVAGPLAPLPQGWCHIAGRGRDSWIGAYHDTQSGAYVSFDTHPEVSADWWTVPGGGRVSGGTVGNATYRLVIVPNPRQWLIKRFKKEIGPSFPEPNSWQEWNLPPSEATHHLAVTLSVGERRWTFGGDTCDRHRRLASASCSSRHRGLSLSFSVMSCPPLRRLVPKRYSQV